MPLLMDQDVHGPGLVDWVAVGAGRDVLHGGGERPPALRTGGPLHWGRRLRSRNRTSVLDEEGEARWWS